MASKTSLCVPFSPPQDPCYKHQECKEKKSRERGSDHSKNVAPDYYLPFKLAFHHWPSFSMETPKTSKRFLPFVKTPPNALQQLPCPFPGGIFPFLSPSVDTHAMVSLVDFWQR